MFRMGSHHLFGHLKHKLWPKEGPRVKLAVKKSRIDHISLRAGDVRHIVKKISMRVTTLL
jgi:predicted nucleic acid-binding Zn finger protein